jgi:hypothetical protein
VFADCQRCSEVLRDHIMRQKPNSALCNRDRPCNDCSKVLEHFSLSGSALWHTFDERAQQNHLVLKRARSSSDGGSPVNTGAKVLQTKFENSAASKPGYSDDKISSSSSTRFAAAAPSFGQLARPLQQSKELAVLLTSLHNQPFDAT